MKKEVKKQNQTNVKKVKLKKEVKKKVATKPKYKKRFLRGLVTVVLILFFVSLFILGGFGIYYLCTSPKYNITNIEIKGNKHYSSEKIVEVAKVPLGTNVFLMSGKNVQKNLKTLPYVGSIKIDKKINGTIEIMVSERTSKYASYNKEIEKYIRLDKYGIILEEVDQSNLSEKEFIVFGINFDDKIVAGTKISQDEINKLFSYENVKGIYDNSKIEKNITSIEFKNDTLILTLNYDINVILQDDEDLEYNIGLLKSILGEIEGKSGTIDMTKTSPTFTEKFK